VATPSELTITTEDPHSADARRLIAELSAEMVARYPDVDDDGSGDFTPDDVLVPGGAFVVARLTGRAVACGALRPMRDDIGEVKRMYVEPGLRGRRIGRAVLAELEAVARRLGYGRLWLETGLRQPEAIRAYEAAGYRRIPRYGRYADEPLSVCFEKRLA
jgi:GNAT superfamily N-acetyltransferase